MRKNVRIELLYEDADLLAVFKPSGLSTTPGRGRDTSLIQILTGPGGYPDLRLVHRIDADTSGVLLLAKGVESQRTLTRMFTERKIAKEYLAIVVGRPSEAKGRIDAPIGPDLKHSDRMCVRKRGRASVTEWELLESWVGYSLLRCRPETGRTHQIRVHLAYAEMPLAVDPLYGSREGIFLSRVKPGYRRSRKHAEYPLIGRLTLHAEALSLEHPRTGESLRFTAEPAKDFRAAMRQLRFAESSE